MGRLITLPAAKEIKSASPRREDAIKHFALCRETALALQELRQGIVNALLAAWTAIPVELRPCSANLNVAPELMRRVANNNELSLSAEQAIEILEALAAWQLRKRCSR